MYEADASGLNKAHGALVALMAVKDAPQSALFASAV
jgi:hypothetical protein